MSEQEKGLDTAVRIRLLGPVLDGSWIPGQPLDRSWTPGQPLHMPKSDFLSSFAHFGYRNEM